MTAQEASCLLAKRVEESPSCLYLLVVHLSGCFWSRFLPCPFGALKLPSNVLVLFLRSS